VWRAVLCHRPETVIASAAKQSILSLRRDGLLRCARNDGRGDGLLRGAVIARLAGMTPQVKQRVAVTGLVRRRSTSERGSDKAIQ